MTDYDPVREPRLHLNAARKDLQMQAAMPPDDAHPRNPKAGSPERWKRYTGASPLNTEVWVVTVEFETIWRIVPEASRLFRLTDPRQVGVQNLAARLFEWCGHVGISSLVCRRRVEWLNTGQASANAWKIETVVQMVPELDVTLCSNQQIAKWVKTTKPVMPPARHLTTVTPNYVQALEAALYAASLDK